MSSFNNVYNQKKILVVGHWGFKGSWLCKWLIGLGAHVVGLSDKVPSEPAMYQVLSLDNVITDYVGDVRDGDLVRHIIKTEKPDFVFHLAAQPIVRESYLNPLETFSVNAIGTATILDVLRQIMPETHIVCITSDKAYDNVESIWGYKETDKLGGSDPYSGSKGAAELVISSFARSFFSDSSCPVKLAVGRAGNVIGGGDWAADRIIPDCMRSWAVDGVAALRNPCATRPWQHVLEPLSGYLRLGQELSQGKVQPGEAFNFGPLPENDYSVQSLVSEMANLWNGRQFQHTAQITEVMHEAKLLKLNCEKAAFHLSWQPVWSFQETARRTVEWYKSYYEGDRTTMNSLTKQQIEKYVAAAKQKGLTWAN